MYNRFVLSIYNREPKQTLYKIILNCRQTFSFRNEILLYANMEVELELNKKTHFYIRPFPIKEDGKITVDKKEKEMFA